MTNHVMKLTTTINRIEYVTEFTFDSDPGPMVLGVMGKGMSELLRDAGSTTKGSQAQKDAAIVKRNRSIMQGTYVFGGGGGGGARQTPEEKGWLAFFAAEKHQEGGKPVNGKTLRRAQEAIVRQELLQQYDAGTPERKDVEANLQKHLEERFDEIVSMIENDPDDPIGALIALEKAKANINTKRGSRLRGK